MARKTNTRGNPAPTKRVKGKTVKVEPTDEHPVPYDDHVEEVSTFEDELAVAASTADLLEELGAPIEVDPSTLEQEKRLLDEVIHDRNTKHLSNLPTATAASSFLRTYGQSLALDINQVRSALTNKLLEIADCGEIRYELKAIEMLGKHSDIGLFTERSEININYNSPESLEAAIKERVKRLLGAEIEEQSLFAVDLEEELGFKGPVIEGEFEEVDDTPEDTPDAPEEDSDV